MEIKKQINTFDYNKIKEDLILLFKSPNPFSIYVNSKVIKENFSAYLSNISKQVSVWFNLDGDYKSFVINIYKQSSYHKIWEKNLKDYLNEAKYFDICRYENYKRIKENKINEFEWMLDIFNQIIYIYNDESSTKDIDVFFNSKIWKNIKISIDAIVIWYKENKKDFLSDFYEIIKELNEEEKRLMEIYMYRSMIDMYFQKVKKLFYIEWASYFQSKEDFLSLKWSIKIIDSISEEWKFFNQELKELYDLKDIIMQIQDNLFSSFLLPIIYHRLSEELNISKRDLCKLKYLLLYIFSENYSEYKKVYNFFTQLEVFLSSDINDFTKKIKLSFSLILFGLIVLFFWFFYMPIWVFLGLFILWIIKFSEVFFPKKYFNYNWNVGVKFFAIAILSISSFFWFQDMDNLKKDFNNISQKTQIIWTTKTIDAIEKTTDYIYTNLLQIK